VPGGGFDPPTPSKRPRAGLGHGGLFTHQREMRQSRADDGGSDRDRGVLVVDVRFPYHGVVVGGGRDFAEAIEESGFMRDREKNQAVRS
jgi:hypothetical protein